MVNKKIGKILTSYREFLDDLESKKEDMLNSWKSDDRVEALKIVIQCLKSLSDCSAVEFYPAKIFHILDLLSTFVDLVGQRLKNMEKDMAKEIAKNWFYKIYSIR